VPRVLLVEDSEDVQNMVAFRLKKAGHRVLTANNADEAIAIVEERGAPDVVVLDVMMPGMDGLDLLPELRSRTGRDDLPAIFLSARIQPQDIEAGRALGATYLTKPFVATALLNAVEAACRDDEGW
jgi:DNA-binding response OmpR family regulator